MIKNSKRIETICEFTTKKIVAEIGADHGLICKKLFDNKKIKFAYLTDISQKSLKKAEKNFDNVYNSQVTFLIGDGLKPLEKIKNQRLEIIIAGMGGREIIKILKQNKNKVYKNFVLQPQKNVVDLRKFLNKNGYKIKKDVIIKDKIFYNILQVTVGNQKLSELNLNFGKTNFKTKSQDFLEYIYFETKKYQDISSKSKSVEKKLKLLKQARLVLKKEKI